MNVYKKAAIKLFDGYTDYACHAIDNACNYMPDNIFLDKFENYFKPRQNLNLDDDIDNQGWYGSPNDENQLARSLALLFMEQIEKDEK